MNSIREKAEKAVRDAGRLFLDAGLHENRITVKGIANFVTEVDYAVQDFLIKELYGIMPGCNVISEELEKNKYDLGRPTWILDPVDGTTNFMYHYRHSAVSLALFVEGEPALGIIYNPHSNELFAGERGKGAFLNGDRIEVSGNKTLEDSLIGFGTTPYDKKKAGETFRITRDAFVKCRDVRRSGSAALDLAYVACGRLDGFFELNLQPWDYAAGMIIVEEAGGTVTNWKSGSLLNLEPDSVLATNGIIHKEMMELIQESLLAGD